MKTTPNLAKVLNLRKVHKSREVYVKVVRASDRMSGIRDQVGDRYNLDEVPDPCSLLSAPVFSKLIILT